MRPEPPVRHCPSCGAASRSATRYCVECAHDFWGAAAGRPAAKPDPQATRPTARGPGELIPAGVLQGPNLAVMVGGVLVVAGSLLPWITTSARHGGLAFSGVDGGGDGWITLAVGLGIIALVFAGRGVASDFNRAAVWLLAMIGAVVFWIDLERVQRAVAGFERQLGSQASASVGIGIWLIALGAVLAFALNIARPRASGVGTLPSIFARGG